MHMCILTYIYEIIVMKRKELLSFAATGIDLEIIMLTELSQREAPPQKKDKFHDITCGLKK